MLNIYYGRESLNKEKFLIDNLDGEQKTFIIVPEQFTVEAEKKLLSEDEIINDLDEESRIMDGMGVKSLMQIQVLSMTRLGKLLLSTLGGEKHTFIDKYGRHILISKVASDKGENLQIFRGIEEKTSFVNEVNEFISQVKLNNRGSDDIDRLVETLPQDSYSKKKLEDLNLIFKAYEERIAGKYTDAEDYMNMVLAGIHNSEIIKDSEIWIYGFDNITKKNISVIEALIQTAKNVKVILNYDGEGSKDEELFQLSGNLIVRLKNVADSLGIDCKIEKISNTYEIKEKNIALKHLEKNLYALPADVFKGKNKEELEALGNGVVLVETANPYNEAESAAAYVLHLVRDKGLRFKDIRLICNDTENMEPLIKRAFTEYGIDVYSDVNKDIMQNPIVQYVISMLETIVEKYRTDKFIFNLKLGFTSIPFEDILELENYGIKYNIRGSMWKKPFKKGVFEYGVERFEKIQAIREEAAGLFLDFEDNVAKKETVGEFIDALYNFLYDRVSLPKKILDFIALQEERGRLDLAEETAQIWNSMVGIFDEIKELFGQEKLKLKEISELIKTGFSQVQIGRIPPHIDSLLMGTTQKSISGNVKALVVLGASEGNLPKEISEDTLFLDDEKEIFKEQGIELLTQTDMRNSESKLGVYRSLCKPTESIYMSYSTGNGQGEAVKPSGIFLKLREIFPQVRVREDILNSPKSIGLINSGLSGMRHLSHRLKESQKGEMSWEWMEAFAWLRENKREDMENIMEAMSFTNNVEPLNSNIAKELYKRDGDNILSLSPSKIEAYGKCPFSYFIEYGLRPEEKRLFQVAPREIGDIYHRCLKKLLEQLSTDKETIRLSREELEQITEEEIYKRVEKILKEEADAYREGVFTLGNEENYRYHRILEVIKKTAWVLIEQIKMGNIKESFMEARFERNGRFKEIPISLSDENIIIEGQIDRVDILPSDKVKIIDYKTGDENFSQKDALGGVRLQLMIYLKAAGEGKKTPAGVFYFKIKEPEKGLLRKGTPEEDTVKSDIIKSFKMNGLLLKDEETIKSIAGDNEGSSPVVSGVFKKKDGSYKDSTNLIEENQFYQLIEQVDHKVIELCQSMTDGKIPVFPAKYSQKTACDYCKYKGICLFDREFKGCRWNII